MKDLAKAFSFLLVLSLGTFILSHIAKGDFIALNLKDWTFGIAISASVALGICLVGFVYYVFAGRPRRGK